MIEKEEFENKFSNFKKTVNTLKNAIVYAKKNENHKEFSMFKDSVIQRFEYTFELSWKFMKYILEKNDDETETRSPKQTIKSAFKI
jgi:nucleotidyltransferase substrate binding protein (TIGR01987 family)